MKKAIALIIAIMLMLSLCACDEIHYEQEKAPVPSSAVNVSYDTVSGSLKSSEGNDVIFTS